MEGITPLGEDALWEDRELRFSWCVWNLVVIKDIYTGVLTCVQTQGIGLWGPNPINSLPDLTNADIDLTICSKSENMKDTWASVILRALENEKRQIKNAEFRVKEAKYIDAKVGVIKCLVENIVVDISFNQIGGLCTLKFLEEVGHLISQNNLFKRNIILIKAWCYYESRILGARFGLISTYTLEILVLYIFHVFNISFVEPFEVLYRFLEVLSNFDWKNFCVSLWGPVPINSLPDTTTELPRKNGGKLLFDKAFLEAFTIAYADSLSGHKKSRTTICAQAFQCY